MDGTLRASGERLVAAARAVRAAFPDVAALREMSIGSRPAKGGSPALAAIGYLWDELALVRDGRATDLTVLDDELAGVERLLNEGRNGRQV